jgi:hypothetical protein
MIRSLFFYSLIFIASASFVSCEQNDQKVIEEPIQAASVQDTLK